MRRLTVLLFVFIFALTALVSSVSAGADDAAFKSATFTPLRVFAEGELGTFQMRGFTASPDGEYLYGGILQNDRGVFRFNATDGSSAGTYRDAEPGFSKGLAADDRGNLYVGISNAANDGAVKFACVDKDLKELSLTTIEIAGKVGVNGATVVKNGDKYLLYFVVNYGPNTIRCYDVTNPAAPVVYKSFGTDGVADIKALCGNDIAEGSYIAVDEAGIVYLTANADGAGSKGDCVLKIAADGKSIISRTAIPEAYGTYYFNGYLLVSTYAGASSAVYVLNASDLSQVATIGGMADASNYSGVALVNKRIYISDQGFGGGDRILVSGELALSEPAQEQTAAPAETAPEQSPDSAPTAPVTGDTVALFGLLMAGAILAGVYVFKRSRR